MGLLRTRTRLVGRFDYRVSLPTNVQEDQAHASLAEGVLTVRVPKSEKARPAQHPDSAALLHYGEGRPRLGQSGEADPQAPWRTVINRAFEGLPRGFWADRWTSLGGANAQCNSAVRRATRVQSTGER